MNLADIIRKHARDRPDHPAIEEEGRKVTYAELDGLVDVVAGNLQKEGLKSGAFVGLTLPNTTDHLILLYALFRTGIGFTPLKPDMTIARILTATAGLPLACLITMKPDAEMTSLRQIVLADLFANKGHLFDAGKVLANSPAYIVQSSGTTGKPKTFIKTQEDFNYAVQRRSHTLDQTDRYYPIIAMSFLLGLVFPIDMLQKGATTVFFSQKKMRNSIEHLADLKITYLTITPDHLKQIFKISNPTAPLFPGLRRMVISTAAVSPEDRLRARQQLTPNIVEMFGTNETGLTAVAVPEDQDKHPGSVGKIIDGIEAEIVDADDNPLPSGEIGHIRFRAKGTPTEYYDDAETSAKAFRNGWFYPGDLGALNDEKYLFFKGRADDIINIAGIKFYPIEVENILLQHPDITEAAIISIGASPTEQQTVACLVANKPQHSSDIREYCRQNLEPYKIPHSLIQISELPRNDMGKILKTELKLHAQELLNKKSSPK